MSTVRSYPTWGAVCAASENATLGMQIILDTYTRTIHNSCSETYKTLLGGCSRELTSDEKTCVIYIEIVLTLKETWQPALVAFKSAKEAQRAVMPEQTTATLV
jgi:hypothetical protein